MLRQAYVLVCLLLGITSTTFATTPPGTLISNTAVAAYELADGTPQSRDSNTVEIVSEIHRTPSTIDFLQYAPTNPVGAYTATIPATSYSTTGDLASPAPYTSIGNFAGFYPLPSTIPIVSAQVFHGGQPLIIRLEDQDQNIDPTVAETALVRITCPDTGDDELLLLTEDSTDSGIFYGYVLTSLGNDTTRNGDLAVTADCTLTAGYTDAYDGQDISIDAALIDPYGFVFDSVTGKQINGASVTLFDVTAGQPAQVLDDFGQPGYPSTVATGDPALNFPTGGFRFPLIEPGREYRLDITPPAGYGSPSTVPSDDLRDRFSQFAIDDRASYGRSFLVNPGPAIHIDVPVDPAASGLWLQKEALDSVVSVGDFLMYTLTVENLDSSKAVVGVTIEDRLPLGFRYQNGSLRINGTEAVDPDIDRNGRQMQINVGDIGDTNKVQVNYVVEIAAGAQLGYAVNRAVARAAHDTVSNQASAQVMVRDDFFRNNAFIMGRVKVGSCETEDAAKEGLARTRIYLEDGTYAVTDDHGMYHFEGVTPGVHVVQLDLNTLPSSYEVLPCEQNTQFSGRTFSQFVDLQGGTLWIADFYVAPKPPPVGKVDLSMNSLVEGHLVTHNIEIATAAVPADNLRLTTILPPGSTYLPGSAKADSQPLADPAVTGQATVFRLENLPADNRVTVSFKTDIDIDQPAGDKTTKAMVLFDSPVASNQKTPLAETVFRIDEGIRKETREHQLTTHFPSFATNVQERDKARIGQLAEQVSDQEVTRIKVVGHSDDQPIASRSRHIHADNQALSEARAKQVGELLVNELKTSEAILDTSGKGATDPVADNRIAAGRAENRRAEVLVQSSHELRSATPVSVKQDSGTQSIATQGATLTTDDSNGPANPPMKPETMPALDQNWLANVNPQLDWVWPPEGHYPNIGTTQVAIQHDPKHKVTLRKDGQDVHPLTYEGILIRNDGKVAVSQWRGIGLDDGDNQFEVVVKNAAGETLQQLSRTVHFSTEPVTLEIVDEYTHLLADGVTKPRLAIRLLDKDGHPVRAGSTGEYQVLPPFYADRFDTKLDREDDSLNSQHPKYVVGRNGIALLTLEPTSTTSEAVFNVKLPDGEQELRSWVRPQMREWILVGFAEGTIGHNTIKDNKVSAADAGIDDGDYSDGQVKFFAKGAIKGEWLLTLAYDSDKPDLDGDSLYQIIDPDTYYPLYGDETQQGYEASSAEKLYVKLERDQFYALFGDMQTGLNQTVLSQYSRNMNGFKSELQSEGFSYTAFAAETKQAFVKDELRGDGTSGRYMLSEKDLVINSEEVVIETRDRFHNEQIIKEERLSRHLDYDINYDTGTLYFKRPVASKDQNFNPIFIVVRYETQDSSSANLNYGGRGAVKLLDQKVEVGGSLIHEENGTEEGDLYGTDVTVNLTPQTTLHAEVATTDVKQIDDNRKGDAYLAEIIHQGETVDGRGWFRQQDKNFGLGQQNGGTAGIRSYGASGAYRFNPRWSLAGETWREDNLDTDAQRNVGSLQALYRAERYGLSAGMREARDTFDSGEKQTSRQMLLGGDWSTPDRKVTLRATHEQSLGSKDKNLDFPTRTMIGADYKLSQRISLFAEQEFTWGNRENTEGTRAGFRATPWDGGEVRSAVEQQINENGQRVFALFGLGQSWQVTKNWSLDLALDRSYTIKDKPVGERVNNQVPQSSGGDDDFTAVSVGAAYRVEKWSWWNRLETRQGDSEDKVGISSGLVGEVQEGVAVSAKLMAFINNSRGGSDSDEEEITLGLAYRPNRSRWILLERLDVSLYNEDGNGSDNDSMRIVNHLHANFRLNRKWQTSFYYGLKYVRENFGEDRYSGYTDMISIETRYNINSKWDIGVHGSLLHSWNSNQIDYSLGGDVGYLVMTNAWVSVGYNLVGFEDEDFSDANYTAEGAYVRFRAKFDQQSVREAAEWINKQ